MPQRISSPLELCGEDIGGIAVHIGARVAARARASEILVSQTVADLVTGSGIQFEPRGDYELKGVPGRWRLYAVRGIASARPENPYRVAASAAMARSFRALKNACD